MNKRAASASLNAFIAGSSSSVGVGLLEGVVVCGAPSVERAHLWHTSARVLEASPLIVYLYGYR